MKTILNRISAAIAVAATGSALTAGAADFYVTTTGSDAGDGSQAGPFATIGAAVAAADAAIAGGETDATIHVAAGTYVGSGHVLTNAIAVVGAGADNTVVDGNGGYRVFSLGSSDAALKGLCVSNGMFAAAGDMGAGVYMEAGLVEDCLIASCGNTKNVCYGGGIYASGGRIRRTTFTGNMVHALWSGNIGYGAALFLTDGAICENSLFTDNAAPPCYTWSGQQFRGGVVHLTGSGTALVNCTVVANRLGAPATANPSDWKNPAGIVQKNGAVVVNCVAYGNDAGDTLGRGYGDIYAASAGAFVNSAWGTCIGGATASPVAVGEAAFMGYAGGNFRPKTDGVLVKGGTSWADYLGYGARSETDLDGNPRRSGRVLDIGCYRAPDAATVLIVK